MKPAGPIFVADRFAELRVRLTELLSDLSGQDWTLGTAARQWSVRDIVSHLLGGDLGILSRRRDGFRLNEKPIERYSDLVDLVNGLNDQWVSAARRLSPRVLCDLLSFTGPQVEAYFASLDPFAIGEPVDWAGPAPAPVWLDVAREFTERWHHQQQIRDATGRPPLYEPYFLAPVLDTFVRALPHNFRDIAATVGTVVKFTISGEAGGCWSLLRRPNAWELALEADAEPATEVVLPQDSAWRLFTKGMNGETARTMATIAGDSALASPLFTTIAVIA